MTAQKTQRYRSYILTPSGLHKLQVGIRQMESQTKIRCSPQKISHSGLGETKFIKRRSLY